METQKGVVSRNPIPKGLRLKAQGCESRATLGKRAERYPTPKGLRRFDPDRGGREGGTTPLGLGMCKCRFPRVALPSFVKSTSEGRQPWALMHNPFGIEKVDPIVARLNLLQFIICFSPARPEIPGRLLILIWALAFAREHREPHGVCRPADHTKQCSHPIGQRRPQHSR